MAFPLGIHENEASPTPEATSSAASDDEKIVVRVSDSHGGVCMDILV